MKKDLNTKYHNERDIEISCLIEFLKAHQDIKKVLDVGCARSFYYPLIRNFAKIFDCVDMEYDKDLDKFLDHYIVGDALEEKLGVYDLVFAISVIEHYGVKQKPVKFPFFKQKALIEKMARTAKKYLFFTFPIGVMIRVEGEFVVETKESLAYFLHPLKDFDFKTRFFFNPEPCAVGPWKEIMIDQASGVRYDPRVGVSCVCIVEGVRKNV